MAYALTPNSLADQCLQFGIGEWIASASAENPGAIVCLQVDGFVTAFAALSEGASGDDSHELLWVLHWVRPGSAAVDLLDRE
jgi:hypothetical protein